MKRATLDLTGCRTLGDLHRRIKKALNFPDHYGKNLDAFWDCISCDCDVNFVTVVGSGSVAPDLRQTVSVILELMEENKQDWAEYVGEFDYEVVS